MTTTAPEPTHWTLRAFYRRGPFVIADEMERAALAIIGRQPDGAGCGCDGERDMEWTCASEIECQRYAQKLRAAGFRVLYGHGSVPISSENAK